MVRHKKFTQQRSILKNSQERSTMTSQDLELLEAKKQIILRQRRLVSHYRQYEQWRRRQFSYDPSYHYRANPLLPIGQADCSNYGSSGGGGPGAAAFRRRRQYRRQYSCAERSREGSHESRESSSLHKYQLQQQNRNQMPPNMRASDTIHTDSSTLNQSTTFQTERISFDSSECGALASCQPLHCNSTSRHIHMLQEEQSTSISERCTRSRINSAIFVSSEGKGFDSIEFLRRHGSQSVLCRKARSAENITDNGRKKSFSENRQWHTDERPDASMDMDTDAATDGIELKEVCHYQRPTTLGVLKVDLHEQNMPVNVTSLLSHSAAVTTANGVVGSISIEVPPSHLKDDVAASAEDHPLKHTCGATKSASHSDSTDTVEELILVPKKSTTEFKSRVLVHQRSSIASNPRSQSQSPHGSPKALSLRGAKPKIAALPMVSVSGPSPPHEKPPPGPSEHL